MLAAGRASASERRRRRRSAYRRRRRGFLRGRSRRRGNFQPLKASPGESGPARRQGRRQGGEGGGEGGRDGGRPGPARHGTARLGTARQGGIPCALPARPCPARGGEVLGAPRGDAAARPPPGGFPAGPPARCGSPGSWALPRRPSGALGVQEGSLGCAVGLLLRPVCQRLGRVTVMLIILG